MKKFTYRKRVKIPIYLGSLEIVLTNTKTELCKDLFINEGHHGTEVQTCDENGRLLYIVAFRINPDFQHGTISHECLHAVIDLFNYIKLQISTDGENGNEAYTYLLAWFVNEVYDFMKEKKIKIK